MPLTKVVTTLSIIVKVPYSYLESFFFLNDLELYLELLTIFNVAFLNLY